jgi:hypothetical protein
MHTVDLLEEALSLAERAGYRVRQECLGGQTGGACEIRGRKWLFLDLDQSPADQLEQVLDALRGDTAIPPLSMSATLQERLQLRRSA